MWPGGVSSRPMWTRIPFDESHLPRVADFDCGSKPYQTEVSDWIKSRDGVLRDMADFGTSVWLYEADNGDVIGFTSLGLHTWDLPDPVTNKKAKTGVQIIPNWAIHKTYKWKPTDPPEAPRYALLVFNDLLQIAHERMTKDGAPSIVGLLVHGDNTRAIELYEEAGFVQLSRNARGYVRMRADF